MKTAAAILDPQKGFCIQKLIFPPPIILYYLGQKINYLSSQIPPVKLEARCPLQSGVPAKAASGRCSSVLPSKPAASVPLSKVTFSCFLSLSQSTSCCWAGPPHQHVIYLSNTNDSSSTRSLRNVGYFLCLYLH